jgi:NADH-quinone oxidoreductase subunit E
MTAREKAFPALLERLKPRCEEIIARYEDERSALLQLMQLFQEHEGFVSPEAMRYGSERLGATMADVEGAVSFYTLLYRRPVGKYVVQVCRGLACSICGAEEAMRAFRDRLGIGTLETTSDGVVSYEEVECLAACDRAPCAQVNLEFVYDLDERKIGAMIAAMRAGTYETAPMAQSERPARTWLVEQDLSIARGERSKGAEGVPSPDDAGGIDRDGVIMLDRILTRGPAFLGATRERLVSEARDVVELVGDRVGSADEGREHA